ncbi:MAG: O-antigen ligase family protein [Aggregatilineales bacterium]
MTLAGLQSEPFIIPGIVLAIIVGAALGLASLVLSPMLIIAVLIGLFLVPSLLKTPVPFLMVMLIGYSTILDVNLVPLVPLGFGSLNLLDIGLLGYLVLVVLRRFIEPGFTLYIGAQGIAILVFMFALIFSTAIGIVEGSTDFSSATTEIRYFSYYIGFFVIAYWIRDRRQLTYLLYGFFFLAAVVSVGMIAQYVAGDSVQIIYGRIEAFAQAGEEAEGVTRVIPAGRYLVLVSFITLTFLQAMHEKGSTWITLAWVLTALGVLLTFNRNFWVSAVFVIGVFMIVVDPVTRSQLLRLLAKSGVVLLILLAVILSSPESTLAQTVTSMGDRFFSLFSSDTYQNTVRSDNNTSSLEFRRIESEYALKRLSPPPLFGLGAGANYRPKLDALDSENFDGRGYIHNAHLWVILKTGVLGYGALMAMFLLTIFRGIRYWKIVDAPGDRAILLGFSLSLIGILTSAIVDPILSDLTWTPVCGILVGVNEVYIRQHKILNQTTPTNTA